MNARFNYDLVSEMMTNANMGWWEADLQSESYFCSEYISNLLGLEKDGIISFEDFNKRILKEEQRHTSIHSLKTIQQMEEAVYLLDTLEGPVWMRSKACLKRTDENGHTKVYGISEIQDGPDMSSASRILQQREHLLHNIYKKLPVGIELYDANGILIDLNDKEQDIFHLHSKEDILGINIFENPNFPEEMKRKLRNHEDADFTFKYDFSKIGKYYKTQKKEGIIDLMTKVTTLYNEQSEPISYLLINADRTETTVAYSRIQEFKNFFKLIGDYAKVGYAHYNMLRKKGDAQHSWYENMGEKEETPLADIIGTYKHIHPEDRVCMIEFLKDAEKGIRNKLSHELRIIREDGRQTWTRTNIIVTEYDPQNNIIELTTINYDITELKETERLLIQAKEKAEEAARVKSSFLANMSHEIRTPLNAIIGFSNLLHHVDNEEEREQFIALINHNNELLLNLINDVLDFSKIEAGRIKLKHKWFNLSNLIHEGISENKHYIQNKVKLIAKNPVDTYLIKHDEMRIKQVLNNLISNALKNTVQGLVEISYEIKGSGVVLKVKDTGCGIPENKLGTIFERFEKVDFFSQGAGLGLPICKSIIEKINGSIKIDSIVGKGSTFSVELPCHVKLLDE